AGYLVRMVEALPEELRGVAVSTFGKVIRRGWDWLGLAPAAADRVSGLIEVPALAESLTLNKADFIRAGARGAIYLAYRKAIQEAVAHQLSLWGDSSEPAERARRRAARPVERDLETELADLADAPALGRLAESTVWVNEAHPACRRAAPSRSEGYHTALAVALALAPLAVDPAKEHAFITAFLASWGAAIERRKGRKRR